MPTISDNIYIKQPTLIHRQPERDRIFITADSNEGARCTETPPAIPDPNRETAILVSSGNERRPTRPMINVVLARARRGSNPVTDPRENRRAWPHRPQHAQAGEGHVCACATAWVEARWSGAAGSGHSLTPRTGGCSFAALTARTEMVTGSVGPNARALWRSQGKPVCRRSRSRASERPAAQENEGGRGIAACAGSNDAETHPELRK